MKGSQRWIPRAIQGHDLTGASATFEPHREKYRTYWGSLFERRQATQIETASDAPNPDPDPMNAPGQPGSTKLARAWHAVALNQRRSDRFTVSDNSLFRVRPAHLPEF